MSIVGRRLRELRLAAGLSQERLGIEADIDPASASARMNRYELGKRVPDVMTLEKLGEVLNAPVAFFYAEPDELAELVLRFHRLPNASRARFKRLFDELEMGDS